MHQVNVTELYNKQNVFFKGGVEGAEQVLKCIMSLGFNKLSKEELFQFEELLQNSIYNGADLNRYAHQFNYNSWRVGEQMIPGSIIYNNKEIIFRDALRPLKIDVDRLSMPMIGRGLPDFPAGYDLKKFALENGGAVSRGYLEHSIITTKNALRRLWDMKGQNLVVHMLFQLLTYSKNTVRVVLVMI